MTHAIGRRAAAVIAAALLGLGVASTATAAAAAPAAQPAAGIWWPHSFHDTSGECRDMRYFLRDSGQYSLANSRCDFYVTSPRYRLLVFIP